MQMDNGKVTALTLLDLTAAFDTIDNSLSERLHGHFGISGTVFQWLKIEIIHFKQAATHSHRWLTFMPIGSSFRRPARVCPWPFSVNNYYSRRQSSYYVC